MKLPLMKTVIVGGGSSALFFLENLIERQQGNSRRHSLTVITSQLPPGDPRAFGTDLPVELVLNTPNYELDEYIPGWREFRASLGIENVLHSSRAIFGKFLFERWVKATQLAGKYFQFKFQQGLVRQITPAGMQYRVETDAGDSHFDSVILCVGNSDPVEVYAVPEEMERLDVYGSALEEIAPEESVTILGSRLTAVDALLRLRSRGHRGKIRIVSPSGRLPRVRSDQPFRLGVTMPAWMQVPSCSRNLSLRDCWNLAVDTLQMKPCEMKHLLDSRLTTIASWGREVREAEAGIRREWQTKAYQASVLVEDLWPHLSPGAQAEFLLRYRSGFLSNLVGIPLASARVVLELMERGQLTIHRGTVPLDHKVLDATGIRPGSITRGIQESLVKTGLARREPNGSLSTDRFSGRVRSAFSMNGPLLCVGELSIGRNFVSSSLETNRRQAIRASQTLGSHLTALDTGKAGMLW